MLNNSSNLYGSEWLALVFANRNKQYGAYELRSQSSNILLKSLFIAAPVFMLFFIGPMVYAHFKPAEDLVTQVVINTQTIDPVHEMKKEELKKEELVKPKSTPQANVKTVKLIANIQVVETPVLDDPPTTKQVQDAVVGNTNKDGDPGITNAVPVTPGDGGGGNGTAEKGMDNAVHEISGVEKYPEFPGGMAAWAKFIQKNLRYPYMAQESNVQGKVYLSFVVEKDGSITDVSIIKGIGYGCDDEAVRVIKKSPKWIAGEQNKQSVRVRYTMPIAYTLQ